MFSYAAITEYYSEAHDIEYAWLTIAGSITPATP
jgi:hypothetical protein